MRPVETRFGGGGASSNGETSRPTGSPSRAAPVFGGAGAAVAHRARHQFAVVVDRRPVVPAMRVEIPRPVHQPNRQGREHRPPRSEEHTSELQSPCNLVCRLLLEKKKKQTEMSQHD